MVLSASDYVGLIIKEFGKDVREIRFGYWKADVLRVVGRERYEQYSELALRGEFDDIPEWGSQFDRNGAGLVVGVRDFFRKKF